MTSASRTVPALLFIAQPCALIGAVLAAFVTIGLIRVSPYDTSMLEAASLPLWYLKVLAELAFFTAAFLFLIYRTLKRQRRSSRPIIISFFVFWQAVPTVLASLRVGALDVSITELLGSCVFLALAVWYLYYKPNVVSYYSSLSSSVASQGGA